MDYLKATPDERRCGAVSPDSHRRCQLRWSDPTGHWVKTSEGSSIGWWWGTAADKCERAEKTNA